MTLKAGYLALAMRLQEASDALASSDIRTRLTDAINDQYRGSGEWGYYIDYIGGADSGDVIYSCHSEIKKASYTITIGDGTSKCMIDFAGAKDVVPRTTYEQELEPAHESAKPDAAALTLIESACTVGPLTLTEAATGTARKTSVPIKLIGPGKGSSAFYPAEALKTSGPRVFKAGTHVYLNHQTAAEEAARPEGDVKNLAGVLESDAVYHDTHEKGPGLYSTMKVFADHADSINEKAPFVGMSIRAGGIAESGAKKDGLPVLKEFTDVRSVDVVTRAGAGGMILTESAASAVSTNPQPNGEENAMTLEEAKALIQAGIKEAVGPLHARLAAADARDDARAILKDIALPEAAKTRIVESVSANPPNTADGTLDVAKFRESVVAAAKAEGEYIASITGGGRVVGMGAAAPVAPKVLTEAEKAEQYKRDQADTMRIFESLGMPTAAATASARFAMEESD